MSEKRMPRMTRGRRPAFFKDKALDAMVTMMLELMAELWVTKERQAAIEDVLTEAHPDLRKKIEAWKPDPERKAALDVQRAEYLQTIMRTLEADFVPRADIEKSHDEYAEETLAEADQ